MNNLTTTITELQLDPWTLIAALLVIVIALLVWLLKRSAQGAQVTAEMRTVAAAVQIQQATLEMLERRLSQLHAQGAEDAARLRENVIERTDESRHSMTAQLGDERTRMVQSLAELREQLNTKLNSYQTGLEQRQVEASKTIYDGMQAGFNELHKQLDASLLNNATELGQRVESLTRTTDERLREIGGQVDRRLAEGFEKTTTTFADVLRRLALIDEAQKK